MTAGIVNDGATSGTALPDAAVEREIAHLLSAYVHCIDDGRYEEWPAFFVEQCTYRVTSRRAVDDGLPMGLIDCESRAMLADRVMSLRRANVYEPHRYRHTLGPSRYVASGTPGVLHVRTGFTVFRTMDSGEAGFFVSGVYDDEIVRDAGRLHFRSRLVVLDSSRVDTLIVIPI